jgi:hypothetical protein
MATFYVTWHLDFYEDGVQRTTVWEMEADSFESLLTRLDGGLEEGEFCPENEFLDLQGNFNLEYARIVDSRGVELLKDPDINLS